MTPPPLWQSQRPASQYSSRPWCRGRHDGQRSRVDGGGPSFEWWPGERCCEV